MSKLDDLRKRITDTDRQTDIHPNVDNVVNEEKPDNGKQEQKRKIIDEDKNSFTKEEQQKMIEKTLQDYTDKGVKLLRREKKLIKNMEHDSKITQNVIIALAVVGLISLVMIREYLPNEAMYAIVIIIGSMMFLPVGMILGWVVFDCVMRCKILRKISHRNYGVVNFVGKGRKMVSKIKNFDYSLIWKQNECWVLTKDRLYQITKDGNAVNDGKQLDPDSIVTLVDTVPVVFVDLDSMEPLAIIKQGRAAVYPMEIGSALKGWVDNQRAKQLANRKTIDIFIYIAIACCVGAIVVSILTLTKVEEILEMIS